MRWLQKFDHRPAGLPTSRDSCSESDEDETKGFLSGGSIRNDKHVGVSKKTLAIVTVVNVCFFLISSALFSAWFFKDYMVFNAAYKRVSAYSPVLDRYKIETKTVKINGTFFPPKEGGSVARHQPNPEDEEIWDEWELTRVYPVTREQLTRMGKDYSTVAKLEDKDWGLGDDAYATVFDVYHQIHCLNSIRKVVYGGYYNKSMARADRVMQRELHLNHCFDILLQALQCSNNMDLIPLVWMYTQEYPFADMSINKQCGDFGKFTDWRKANTINMTKYVEVMRQPERDKPGIKQLPAADQYYSYWNYSNPNHKPISEGGLGLPLDDDSNL